jgi:hypothetical protein
MMVYPVALEVLAMKAKHGVLTRWSVLLLLICTLSTGLAPVSAAGRPAEDLASRVDSEAVVSLRAASGATIAFTTQNGQTIDGVAPETHELPHLVLHRNGTLTDPEERTLLVEVSGLDLPPEGLTVVLELMTMHGDPDPGDKLGQRIPVWRASRRIANATGVRRRNVTTTFAHRFGATVGAEAEAIATPSDYVGYTVTVSDSESTRAVNTFSQEYALLIEDQWIAPLPEVAEEAPGAAPDELLIYYCDMFPFRRSVHDPETWLDRKQITSYVGTELAPRMAEAFRVQSSEWGFSWHQAWTSYRAEAGPRRLSVALTDGRTWFHGAAPSGGHSAISLTVTGGNSASFAALTDGLLSTFHHELFHNMQRSILLHSGGEGDVGGARGAWQFFSEGTAVLAASVGQPRGQFVQMLPARTYMGYANGFVWRGGGPAGGLNIGYRDLDPYEAAIYWRFLYEQCEDGAQQGSAGMRVIRRVLSVLYSGQVVDIRSSVDLVAALPEIMDQALAGSSCPFQTYDDSLIAFARGIRSLRWAKGRCLEPGLPAGCAFYDPYRQYHEPPVSTIASTGADQSYQDQIGTSFGIDLIDVQLDTAAAGEPLNLEFRPAAGSAAEFSVELWQGTALAWAHKTARSSEQLAYVIPASDMTGPGTLSLIITRLDAREVTDPVGGYSIVLRTGPPS